MASHYAKWISQGSFSLLDRFSAVGFGFVNIFFLVRILPKHDIGIWVLFCSVAAILEMTRAGFIRNPLITHLVSSPPEQKATLTTSSLILHCCLALTISGLLILGTGPIADFWNSPELKSLLLIYAINNIIFIPYFHFEYLQVAHSRFKAVFFCNLVRLGFLTIYIVYCYFSDTKLLLIDLAIAQTLITAFASFISYWNVRPILQLKFTINRKLIHELLHFGKFTFGTNISSMFVRSTDCWMIGRFLSPASVGLYNPAIKLANLLEVPTTSIANIIFPKIFTKLRTHGKAGVRNIYIRSVALMLAIIIPAAIPFYVFAEFFVTVIFGHEYIGAANILRITILYSLVIPFNRQFGTVMDGLKKPRLNFYLLVMTAVLNVIFNYFGLLYFGLIGSAYGTLLSFSTIFVLNQVILYRAFKINALSTLPTIIEWYGVGWDFLRAQLAKPRQQNSLAK
jgi:lipopolysaccharide exporter